MRCTLHWLQLNKRFSLLILLRNQQTFFHTFFLLEVGRSYHSTQFLNTYSLQVFPYFSPAHFFFIRLLKPCLSLFFFVCVAFQPTFLSPVLTLPYIRQYVHSFTLQWLPTLIPLGMSAQQIFGPCLLFPNLQIWLGTIWPPLSLWLQQHRLNFAHI